MNQGRVYVRYGCRVEERDRRIWSNGSRVGPCDMLSAVEEQGWDALLLY